MPESSRRKILALCYDVTILISWDCDVGVAAYLFPGNIFEVLNNHFVYGDRHVRNPGS